MLKKTPSPIASKNKKPQKENFIMDSFILNFLLELFVYVRYFHLNLFMTDVNKTLLITEHNSPQNHLNHFLSPRLSAKEHFYII